MAQFNGFQSAFGSLGITGGFGSSARQQSAGMISADDFDYGFQTSTTTLNSQTFIDMFAGEETREVGSAREYPTKKRSFVEELREEIKNWHGDCLAA